MIYTPGDFDQESPGLVPGLGDDDPLKRETARGAGEAMTLLSILNVGSGAPVYYLPFGQGVISVWRRESGAGVNIWQSIDEGLPFNDADYIEELIHTSGHSCEILVTKPAFVRPDQQLTFLYRVFPQILNPATSLVQFNMVVSTTVGVTLPIVNLITVPNQWTTIAYTLTGAQKNTLFPGGVTAAPHVLCLFSGDTFLPADGYFFMSGLALKVQ